MAIGTTGKSGTRRECNDELSEAEPLEHRRAEAGGDATIEAPGPQTHLERRGQATGDGERRSMAAGTGAVPARIHRKAYTSPPSKLLPL